MAVVVGIGDYPGESGLAPLTFAKKDAETLGSFLKTQGYAVRMFVDSRAQRSFIERALEDASQIVEEEGTLLFYFSGHGFESEGQNYLMAYGATADSARQDGMPVSRIVEILKGSTARTKVFLIDACRDDTGKTVPGRARTFHDFAPARGVRGLVSSQPGKKSYESAELKHGIFTHFLMEALRGAATTDEFVSFQDVVNFMRDRVPKYGFENGVPQMPTEKSDDAVGDFLLSIPKKTLATVANSSGTQRNEVSLPKKEEGRTDSPQDQTARAAVYEREVRDRLQFHIEADARAAARLTEIPAEYNEAIAQARNNQVQNPLAAAIFNAPAVQAKKLERENIELAQSREKHAKEIQRLRAIGERKPGETEFHEMAISIVSAAEDITWADRSNKPAILEAAERALRLAPNLSSALLLRSNAYWGSDQYREAISDLEEARHLSPENLRITALLASRYASIGRTEEASRLFALNLKQSYRDSLTLFLQEDTFWLSQQHQKALENLELLINSGAAESAAFCRAQVAALNLARIQDAKQYSKGCRGRGWHVAFAKSTQALITGKPSDAEKEFSALLKEFGDDATSSMISKALVGRARARTLRGAYTEAVKDYSQTLLRFPFLQWLWEERAAAKEKMGDLAGAAEDRKSAKLAPMRTMF